MTPTRAVTWPIKASSMEIWRASWDLRAGIRRERAVERCEKRERKEVKRMKRSEIRSIMFCLFLSKQLSPKLRCVRLIIAKSILKANNKPSDRCLDFVKSTSYSG